MSTKNARSIPGKVWSVLQKSLKDEKAELAQMVEKAKKARKAKKVDKVAMAERVKKAKKIALLSAIGGLGWEKGPRGKLSLLTLRSHDANRPDIVTAFRKFVNNRETGLGKIEVRAEICADLPPLFLLGATSEDLLAGLPHRHYGDKLRPGSSIVRVVDGQERGPSGTLTCFLSSADGDDLYFLAASHILTNYWDHGESREGEGDAACGQVGDSVYRNIRGYPSAVRPRFLGKVYSSSCPPPCPEPETPDLDAGLVKVENDFFELVQRTTCYGSFGELPKDPPYPYAGDMVTKCGAEEPHGGCARVVCLVETPLSVYGPSVNVGDGDHEYCFEYQVLLTTNPLPTPAASEGEKSETESPRCPCGEANCRRHSHGSPDPVHDYQFAAPGDSGAMIVDYDTKAPVGMLFAGSVLTGYYLMTPIKTLKKYWEKKGLIFRRG